MAFPPSQRPSNSSTHLIKVPCGPREIQQVLPAVALCCHCVCEQSISSIKTWLAVIAQQQWMQCRNMRLRPKNIARWLRGVPVLFQGEGNSWMAGRALRLLLALLGRASGPVID